MWRACVAMAAAGASGSIAAAQALNINFAGVLGPNPSDSYGAAAGQTGYWNPVGLDDPLHDLEGSPTPARIAVTGSGAVEDIPDAAGDDEALMETVFIMAKSGNVLSVYNLDPGFYDLYLYMWGGHFQGEDHNGFGVFNGVDTLTGGVDFDGVWPGGHVEGVTYRSVRIEVLPQFRGFSIVYGSRDSEGAYVNGLQLVPVPAPSALSAVPLAGLIACRRRRRE